MNIKLVLTSFILAITLSGCDNIAQKSSNSTTSASQTTNQTAPTQQLTASKTNPSANRYVMAVEGSYAPFVFKNESGKVQGFEVDIIRAIAEKQGFEVDIITQPWEGIFAGLSNGSRDIIGSGVIATPERASSYALSDPFLQIEKVAVCFDNAKDINSFADLKNKTVAVQLETPFAKVLKDYMGTGATNIKEYETSFLAFKDMLNGKVDAVFGNEAINNYYINLAKTQYQINNLKVIKYPDAPPDNVVFVVKQGRTDLLQKINAGLAQIKKDGTYDKIYTKWFGISAPAVVNAASATASVTK